MVALSYFGIEFSLLIEYVNSKRNYFTKKLKQYSFEKKIKSNLILVLIES
jgi:hypothetical protein